MNHYDFYDFDNMDLCVMEQKILEVKELLSYLNDSYEKFPYDVYFEGSSWLRKAASYVDDVLIHQNYGESTDDV